MFVVVEKKTKSDGNCSHIESKSLPRLEENKINK